MSKHQYRKFITLYLAGMVTREQLMEATDLNFRKLPDYARQVKRAS